MYALKIYVDNQKRIEDQELNIELARTFMALFANKHRVKGEMTYSPTDFFKLSYDTVLNPESDPELYARTVEMLNDRIRRNNREQ